MKNLAFLIAAFFCQPHRDDFARFGLVLMPAFSGEYHCSPMRSDWRWTVKQLDYAVKTRDYERIQAAAWRERVYYYADDIADSNRPDSVRTEAARQLKLLLGATDYYRGKMPKPWVED